MKKKMHSPMGFKKFTLLPAMILGVVVNNLTFAQALQMNCSHVFAISGGSNPSANHARYYTNIKRVHDTFKNCDISNFIATGKEDDKVVMTYEKIPTAQGSFEKILLDDQGLPILQSISAEGGVQGAAQFNDLKSKVENWTKKQNDHKDEKIFSTTGIKNDAPVVFYVTDHGSKVNGQGMVVLWNGEYLSPQQMNKVLNELPAHKKAIMLYDQCYGGEMFKSLWNEQGEVRKNTCGIAAASPGQLAFNGGGTMKHIERMLSNYQKGTVAYNKMTYENIHRNMQKDPSIISNPILSSDFYAGEWFEKNFGANYQKNIVENFLKAPKNQCLSLINPQTGQNLNDENLKNIPIHLLIKLKKYWQEKTYQYSLSYEHEDILKMSKELEQKTNKFQESFKNHNEYLTNTYNPAIMGFVKNIYPFMSNFLKLKDKFNKKEQMTDEEQQEFKKMKKELDMITVAVKDESRLIYRGFDKKTHYPVNRELASIVNQLSNLDNQKVDDWNSLYRTKDQLIKLTTLNALEMMVKKNDIKAIENYLNIVDCEKTPLLK